MIRAAVKGETAKINWPYGPAEILYGKDAAKGTVLAALQDKFKDTLFHIGNGIMLSGDDIAAAVRKSLPRVKRRFDPRKQSACRTRTRAWPATSPVPRSNSAMNPTTPSIKPWWIMG